MTWLFVNLHHAFHNKLKETKPTQREKAKYKAKRYMISWLWGCKLCPWGLLTISHSLVFRCTFFAACKGVFSLEVHFRQISAYTGSFTAICNYYIYDIKCISQSWNLQIRIMQLSHIVKYLIMYQGWDFCRNGEFKMSEVPFYMLHKK